jgi:hypothetical protein
MTTNTTPHLDDEITKKLHRKTYLSENQLFILKEEEKR